MFWCNSIPEYKIITNICKCHDHNTIMARCDFCSYPWFAIPIIEKGNFTSKFNCGSEKCLSKLSPREFTALFWRVKRWVYQPCIQFQLFQGCFRNISLLLIQQNVCIFDVFLYGILGYQVQNLHVLLWYFSHTRILHCNAIYALSQYPISYRRAFPDPSRMRCLVCSLGQS